MGFIATSCRLIRSYSATSRHIWSLKAAKYGENFCCVLESRITLAELTKISANSATITCGMRNNVLLKKLNRRTLSRYLHSMISAFSSFCLCPTPFNVESEVRLNSCGKKNTNFLFGVSKHAQIISQYQNILALGSSRSFAINSGSVYQHQYSKKDFGCDYNRQLIRQSPIRIQRKNTKRRHVLAYLCE